MNEPKRNIDDRLPQENKRSLVLRAANEIVNGDRNVQYGDPNSDFKRIARYWNNHLQGVLERKLAQSPYEFGREMLMDLMLTLIDPHDVAILMGQVKDSRLAWSPEKADSWCDKAGYAACGFDTSKARVEELP